MEWIPDIATRLAFHKAKLKLVHERTLELREIHSLIANYFDRLLDGPTPIRATGILDYFDPSDFPTAEAMFARYKCVDPHDIRSRNLTRVAQLATAGNMEFHTDALFDREFRACVFGVVKAAGILQSGHHLNQRSRNKFSSTPPRTNTPVPPDSKRIAIERFALRWLDLSKHPQIKLLPDGDMKTLLETYDSVNEISHGELATLANRSVLENPGLLPAVAIGTNSPAISRIAGPLFGRRQSADPNRFR